MDNQIKRFGSALVPVLAFTEPTNASMGTGFLLRANKRLFLIGSEHQATTGKEFFCVLPDVNMTAARVHQSQFRMPLKPEVFFPERHQVIFSFPKGELEEAVCKERAPIEISEIGNSSEFKQGEDVMLLGFWSKHPTFGAQLRKGYVSVEGGTEVVAELTVVQGNSGAPVWRVKDGKVIGTAQKNLYDQMDLEKPIAGERSIANYSDLVVIPGLDRVVAWMGAQNSI